MEKIYSAKNGYDEKKLVELINSAGGEITRKGNVLVLDLHNGKFIFTSWGSVFLIKYAELEFQEKAVRLRIDINWLLFILIVLGSLFLSMYHFRSIISPTSEFLQQIILIPTLAIVMISFYIFLLKNQMSGIIKKARQK